jgi:hypothetical protein
MVAASVADSVYRRGELRKKLSPFKPYGELAAFRLPAHARLNNKGTGKKAR